MKMLKRSGQISLEIVAVGVVFFFAFIALMSCWVTIPQGTVGVVFDKARGGIRPETLGEGWHTRMPFTTTIQEYPVSLRTYNAIGIGEGSDKESNSLDLPTAEGQHINQ